MSLAYREVVCAKEVTFKWICEHAGEILQEQPQWGRGLSGIPACLSQFKDAGHALADRTVGTLGRQQGQTGTQTLVAGTIFKVRDVTEDGRPLWTEDGVASRASPYRGLDAGGKYGYQLQRFRIELCDGDVTSLLPAYKVCVPPITIDFGEEKDRNPKRDADRLKSSIERLPATLSNLLTLELSKLQDALPLMQHEMQDNPQGGVVQSVQQATDIVNTCAELVIKQQLETATDMQHLERLQEAVYTAQKMGLTGAYLDEATQELNDMTANSIENLTLARSQFKKLYSPDSEARKKAESGMPKNSDSVFKILKSSFMKRAGKSWTQQEVDTFFDGLRSEVYATQPNPDPVQLVVYLWTSFKPLLQDREFCFWFNDMLRADDTAAIEEMMPIILLLNKQLVTRLQSDKHVHWPRDARGAPIRCSHRGCGMPEERWVFFKAGRKFRVAGGLASSLAERTSYNFARRSRIPTKALFEIRFSRYVEHPSACEHVSLILESLAAGEAEFLFAPYSKFQVLTAMEQPYSSTLGGRYIHVVIEAYVDNQGDEHLPCVAWL